MVMSGYTVRRVVLFNKAITFRPLIGDGNYVYANSQSLFSVSRNSVAKVLPGES